MGSSCLAKKDLALIIIDKHPDLIVIPNRLGFSPLKLLATRPSAFQSGCKMIWWKRILYHCIPVGILNVEEAVKYCAMKQNESSTHDKCPTNYDTCYFFLQKCKDYAYPLTRFAKQLLMKETTSTAANGSKNVGEKRKVFQNSHHIISIQSKHKLLPENYATCIWFMKFACIYILGLSGVGVEEITKMKQKHKWSGQLLNKLMDNPYESYLGTGTKPIQYVSGTDFISVKPNQGDNNTEEPTISKTLESETAILTASRNGIVEIVDDLIKIIPSSIYEVNLENKNVLLVAVENRRTIVVEALRKRFEECNRKALFDNLIQGVDVEENTVLHLAATKVIEIGTFLELPCK